MLTPQQETQFTGVLQLWLSGDKAPERVAKLRTILDDKQATVLFALMLEDIVGAQTEAINQLEENKQKVIASRAEAVSLKDSVDVSDIDAQVLTDVGIKK